MSEGDDENVVIESTPRQSHRVAILVAGSIVVAFVLVVIALQLYNSSDAAQLDLSGPRYKGVQDQVSKDNLKDFPPTGPIDQKTIDEFRKIYDLQASKVTQVDSFGNNALDDQAIGFEDMQPDTNAVTSTP